MSTIVPHYRSIQDLLKNKSFSIDEYQREYKWEKKHVDELLSDLLDKFYSCYKKSDEPKNVEKYEEYFLGSIIVSNRNGKFYLIDGQQRVTSLTLILIYLYRSLSAANSNQTLLQSLSPLIISDDYGELKYNLDIPERVPVINALFKGEPFNSDGKDESIQTIFARYEDIKQNDQFDDLDSGLAHFAYWLMRKVGLIEIASSDDTYAYAIFETMNDRGKPLSPVDMLKAYLLVPVLDTDKRREANEVWKRGVFGLISWSNELEPESERDASCIKAWLRSQYADSTRPRRAGAKDEDWERIGTVFHRWVRDNRKRLDLGKQEENLRWMTTEFPFFARAYKLVLTASKELTDDLESVYYNSHNDFTWQSTVLLSPLVSTDNDETVRRKIGATATYLDIWLMRRVVNYIRVGYSSTSYAMFLLCKEIRRKPLSELLEILDGKLREDEDEVTFEGSPQKGRLGIDDLRVNQFSRRYIFHLLARVTAFVEVNSGRPQDTFDKFVDRNVKNPYDIEHIWPDNYESFNEMFESSEDFTNCRNHAAALLLLPADVNRSLQDKPFPQKVPHYAKQNLYAASLSALAYQHQPQFEGFCYDNKLSFKQYETFGKHELTERRNLLKDLVGIIWSSDRLNQFAH